MCYRLAILQTPHCRNHHNKECCQPQWQACMHCHRKCILELKLECLLVCRIPWPNSRSLWSLNPGLLQLGLHLVTIKACSLLQLTLQLMVTIKACNLLQLTLQVVTIKACSLLQRTLHLVILKLAFPP